MDELEYLAQFIDAHRAFRDRLFSIMIGMEFAKLGTPQKEWDTTRQRRFKTLHQRIDRVNKDINKKINQYNDIYHAEKVRNQKIPRVSTSWKSPARKMKEDVIDN